MVRLLCALEYLFEPLLLRCGCCLALLLRRHQRLLNLPQRAMLFLKRAFQRCVLFLHVEERLFHHGAFGSQARYSLRFRHHGPWNRRRWGHLPVHQPAEETTS